MQAFMPLAPKTTLQFFIKLYIYIMSGYSAYLRKLLEASGIENRNGAYARYLDTQSRFLGVDMQKDGVPQEKIEKIIRSINLRYPIVEPSDKFLNVQGEIYSGHNPMHFGIYDRKPNKQYILMPDGTYELNPDYAPKNDSELKHDSELKSDYAPKNDSELKSDGKGGNKHATKRRHMKRHNLSKKRHNLSKKRHNLSKKRHSLRKRKTFKK